MIPPFPRIGPYPYDLILLRFFFISFRFFQGFYLFLSQFFARALLFSYLQGNFPNEGAWVQIQLQSKDIDIKTCMLGSGSFGPELELSFTLYYILLSTPTLAEWCFYDIGLSSGYCAKFNIPNFFESKCLYLFSRF